MDSFVAPDVAKALPDLSDAGETTHNSGSSLRGWTTKV